MPDISTRIRYLLLTICFAAVQACNVINPAETVPTYIHIDTFAFDTQPPNPNERISLAHKISTITASYNGVSIGTFDLPATIPVMAKGNGKLTLEPGIIIDAQSNLTGSYPFYRLDTSTFAAQPGKVINYVPKTGYYKSAVPYIISDFEAGHSGFAQASGNVLITLVTADSLIYEGTAAGAIYLSHAGDSSEDSTTISFPIAPTTAFIEFNYKTDVPFYVGLQAKLSTISSTPYYFIGLNPTGEWQKAYLNVSGFNGKYQGTSYNFYIKTVLPAGQSSGRMLIDNIQLITF